MSTELKPIDQQVMVITGASSGIGLATAISAAARGAKVALLARSEETLDEIVMSIEGDGGEALAIPVDVADRQAVEAAADQVVSRFGRIDTWVNNAGVSIYGRIEEVSDEDNRRLFETNFWGVVYGSLAALPYLRQAGGSLVNVGSEVSDAVVPLQGMYSTSKHAVKGFTDSLRVEVELVEKAAVSISLIQPTAVNTPYPEHARNYMDKEPKLPTPQIDPYQVADAIIDAATQGGRDIKVGAMSKMNTLMASLLPRLADRMSAMQAQRQQKDQSPRTPEGALFEGGQSGRVYGTAP
ncbi:MAG: SDR family NAD(P)-dependent oxidoreductase [Alphaproteobacteria bacterium]|nr:MAG: SDR family NAD(P)-dependent oxidoreductase [Alphaproteobacteria bacterium]